MLAFTVQPTNTEAGQSITPALQVTARDSVGNTVTGFTRMVTVEIDNNPSGGTLSGDNRLAAVSGVATFSDLSIDAAGNGYTLTATTTGGVTGTTSDAFNITAGAATQLAFTVQPGNTTAGVDFSPALQVTARDAEGNTDTGFTGNVTLAIGTNPSGGVLDGTVTVAAVNGVATFGSVNIDEAGNGYTLTASSGALTQATSNAFNITTAPASVLAFTVQPTNTAAGASITPAVQVTARDSVGNTVTSFTGDVTVAIGTNPSSGALSGTTTVAAVSGVATFSNLSIDLAGDGYTLTATSGALTQATSDAFNITAGAATQLVFTVQPTNTQTNATITPAVQVTVQDDFGNTVTTYTSDVTVGIGTNPSGGSLGGTLVVAASAGVAAFSDLSIDTAGTGYTLTADSGALPQATSTAFDITTP